MSGGAAQFAFVWCPCGSREEARRLAHALVGERLVACVNIIGPVLSVFAWEGKIDESEEYGLLCKTSAEQMAVSIARLDELHSYDTPVIVGWRADQTTPETLAWLGDALGSTAG
ncbi:divalent-cation tolerance protein CutA [Aurantiacibacter flavus]|uniref:Divalent-cation tolerance protein CutA n=1 Tax=Aurantiacibacter flavus TaxID=3145232 RepID=A0ABV0CX01_9SPHN